MWYPLCCIAYHLFLWPFLICYGFLLLLHFLLWIPTRRVSFWSDRHLCLLTSLNSFWCHQTRVLVLFHYSYAIHLSPQMPASDCCVGCKKAFKRHSTHLAQNALCASYYKAPHEEISVATKTTITNNSHVNITSSHVSQEATQSCLHLRSSSSWLWKPLKSTSLWWLGPDECRMLTTMSMMGIDLMKHYKWFKRSSNFDGNCLKTVQIYQYYDTVT